MRIDWKDSYKTGNTKLDAQNQQWFDKVNCFFDAQDKPSCMLAAIKMREFTQLHFQEENRLMLNIHYPDTREHSLRHKDTLLHMDLLLQQLEHDALDMEKCKLFLTDLFYTHVAHVDLQLAAFVSAQRIAATRRARGRDSQQHTAGNFQEFR